MVMDQANNSLVHCDQKTVLVIGAGVAGLTAALCLARERSRVIVIADRFAPRVTSAVAGALWEWPPAVCGMHQNTASLASAKRWSDVSYRVFAALSRDATTGVFLRPVTFYFKRRIGDDSRQAEKMNEYKDKVDLFRHDSNLIAEHGINPNLGYLDAYTHLAPMIDTDAYMRWLLAEVLDAGGQVIEETVVGSLRDQEAKLLTRHNADAIVNCSGLGARELTGDPIVPLRGALIRVCNDGVAMPRIAEAHCVSHNGSEDDHGFIFIVPRGNDMLVLGGLAEPDEWNVNIDLANHLPVRDIFRRCVEFLPALGGAIIDAAEPVRVGLRPFRRQGVCLENEPGTRIIHNYGHGGSGVTYSWGCGFDVVKMVTGVTSKNSNAGFAQTAPL